MNRLFYLCLICVAISLISCEKKEVVEVVEETEIEQIINNELVVQIDTIQLSLLKQNDYSARVARMPDSDGVSFTPRVYGRIGLAFVALPARAYYGVDQSYLVNYSFDADSVTVFHTDPNPEIQESLDRDYIFLWMPSE